MQAWVFICLFVCRKKRCLFVETFNEDEDEDVRLLTPGKTNSN